MILLCAKETNYFLTKSFAVLYCNPQLMKRLLFGASILLASFCISNESSAQLSVAGSFSKSPIGNGWYNIGCSGQGYCGVLGRTFEDGGTYFKASDGSEWRLYFTVSSVPPKEQLERGRIVPGTTLTESEREQQ